MTVPTSKNMVKLASTRARSGSVTELTAKAIRDGYSSAIPNASTAVPRYTPLGWSSRASSSRPPLMPTSAAMRALPSPNRSGSRAPTTLRLRQSTL